MPISASVSASAQSSTTTAMFEMRWRNVFGSLRSALSTRTSNWRRVTTVSGRACPRRELEAANALDVDDVGHFADGRHDLLQLMEVGDLDHEIVDPATIVGDLDLRLGDVAIPRGDGPGDLRQEPRPIAPDVDRDPHRTLGRLLSRLVAVPLHVHQPFTIEDALHHRQAIAAVDGQPAPAGDEPHDLIARQRVAALGEADEQVIDPADADPL